MAPVQLRAQIYAMLEYALPNINGGYRVTTEVPALPSVIIPTPLHVVPPVDKCKGMGR